MKPLVLYDPIRNEYLSKMYFSSLGIHNSSLVRIANLEETHNATILTNGDFLKPELIVRLKNQNCTLIAFDINDHSSLSDSYRYEPELSLIDLIFKVGGIQKQNESHDLSIDQDFNFTLKSLSFLTEDAWNRYKALSDASRLLSLPYVPWVHLDAPQRSYEQKSGHVLVRGGNHFYRFMVFLNLLKIGGADARSSFVTADYFRRDMNPQFKNCESCIQEKESDRAKFSQLTERGQCTSPAEWGGEKAVGLESHQTANRWNNRCPRSFFWLTQKFEERHGSVDHSLVEQALNGRFEPDHQFLESLSQATFYTDLKWIFSIYAPPRFWEAAKSRTINFLPRRTNEQSYFPHIEEGTHYQTFLEDFTDFNPQADEQVWRQITDNCREAYEGWILPGHMPISERLCRHIFTQIERVAS